MTGTAARKPSWYFPAAENPPLGGSAAEPIEPGMLVVGALR
jgi:hypothetical protein